MKHSNFKTNVHNLVLAAMFLALALVLPFLTGQIPQIGGMLLPMHLPVFLCGLICGWQFSNALNAHDRKAVREMISSDNELIQADPTKPSAATVCASSRSL